ncbi:hypothetical protein R3P82_12765 [Dietzia maris]|uniref:Uncharacterized protein n=1 Tax=Dietzia maris TaxID=37915 RepID=A0AAE4U5K9_9ACTN|nr:hypothetical protein [Dietzia maris]MDV6299982.1 hypothetical protein [Dietzia maris]
MIAGEVRVVDDLAALRECPPHTAISDARGRIGTLAQRHSSTLAGGVYWAGHGGLCDASTIEFPVQAWWPEHPALAKGA